MRINLICLMALSLTVSACNFADEKKMREKYQPKAEAVLLNDELIPSFIIEPREALNEFQLVLKFPEEKNELLTVQATIGGHPSQTFDVGIQQTTIKLNIKGGEKYNIVINRIQETGSQEVTRFEGTALPDKVIEGVVSLDADLIGNFYRFILKDDATLLTNGFTVNINSQKLYVGRDSTIQTFSPTQHAKIGANGRNGGNIELVVNQAIGILKIQGRGEHGGDGANGKEHSQKQAKSGYNGKNADSQCFGLVCNCERNAGSGGNGADGLNGNNGQNGGKGGDAATILVTVKDDSEFRLNALPSAGNGGAPGQPGTPQLGGAAGLRGQGADGCENAGSNGRKGADGKPGKPGLPGLSGQVKTPCLRLGEKVMGCDLAEISISESALTNQ